MKRVLVIVILLLGLNSIALSQDEGEKVVLNGYITTMQSVMFDSLSGTFTNENLLHNRLNFKGYLSNRLIFAVEFRNRLFTGDMVKAGSYYPYLI